MTGVHVCHWVWALKPLAGIACYGFLIDDFSINDKK